MESCLFLLIDCFPLLSQSQTLEIFFVLQTSNFMSKLTTGSYISVCSLRYEACGKFGKLERCIGIALNYALSNSSFLSALQTSQVLHTLMNAQLTYEPIVL